jgi:TonB family protein
VSHRNSALLLLSVSALAAVLGLAVSNASAQEGKKTQDSKTQPVLRRVKTRVEPIYPELARHMNLSGVVKVELVIGPDGKVKSAKVLGGHPVLAAAALDASKRWVFEPAREQTIDVVTIRFTHDSD